MYRKQELDAYLQNDWIEKLLKESYNDEEKEIRTNSWLEKMDNKRMIYADVYGDILTKKSDKSVLDVGGGLNSLTKILANNSEYTLVDFLAHGGQEYLKKHGENFNIEWYCQNWDKYEPNKVFDIIIANDIFPDVDQRMELFIEKFLPYCKEMRLVLTFYNEPKYYEAKRVDDAEVLTFLSWDGEITALKLKKYLSYMIDTIEEEIDKLIDFKESIYWNGRQVVYLILKGLGK